jgi:hypothetical protein
MASAVPPCALTNGRAREGYLKALCAFAEGAAVVVPPCSAEVALCVIALFADAQRRVARLGGREGMSRSIGSLYGGLVALFLGSTFRGRVTRTFATQFTSCGGVAITRDGSAVLISNFCYGDDAIYVFHPETGELLRIIGCKGYGQLQFNFPFGITIAPDDHIYVSERTNNRVQVLTPCFDFHSFVGADQLHAPVGVCASDEIVAVSEIQDDRISVFRRTDGALLRRFGSSGSRDGELLSPFELCFLPGCSRIAVVEPLNYRISVYTLEGAFVGHLGVGLQGQPTSVVCSAFGEVVIFLSQGSFVKLAVGAGSDDKCCTIASFTYHAFGHKIRGVALHGSVIFAHTFRGECLVLT